MGEEIEHNISWLRAGFDDSFDGFEWLLCIADGNIFFHPIEHLLNINPDIPGPNIFRLAAFQILGRLAIHLFVVTPQNFGDICVLYGEKWTALRVICLLYTSPSPRDKRQSRMPSSA